VRPFDALIDVDGTLYGRTYGGGERNRGTVLSISRSGEESIVHRFGYAPGRRRTICV